MAVDKVQAVVEDMERAWRDCHNPDFISAIGDTQDETDFVEWEAEAIVGVSRTELGCYVMEIKWCESETTTFEMMNAFPKRECIAKVVCEWIARTRPEAILSNAQPPPLLSAVAIGDMMTDDSDAETVDMEPWGSREDGDDWDLNCPGSPVGGC